MSIPEVSTFWEGGHEKVEFCNESLEFVISTPDILFYDDSYGLHPQYAYVIGPIPT